MKSPLILLGICVLIFTAGCDVFVSPAARVKKAEQAIATGDYGRATVELRNVLKSEPQNTAARIKLIEALLLESNASAAEAEAMPLRTSEAASQNPDILAQIYLAKGDFNGLLEAMKSGRLVLSASVAPMREAQALLGLGRAQEAAAKLEQIIGSQPENIEASVTHAEALVALGNAGQAVKEFDAVLSLSPEYARAWLAKGILYARQGQPVEAIQAFANAVQHAAGQLSRIQQGSALSLLAEQQLITGNVQAAAETQRRLAALFPDAAATLLVAARVAYAKGDYSAAIGVLQKILAKQSGIPAAQLLLGKALVAQGNVRQAESELERLVTETPNNSEARKTLASVYLKLDQSAKALEILAPAAGIALDAQAEMLLRQAQDIAAKSPAVLEQLNNSLKREPANETLRLVVADTLLRARQVDQAIVLLQDTQQGNFDARRVPLLLDAVLAAKDMPAVRMEADRMGAKYSDDSRYLAAIGIFFAGKQEYGVARVWLDKALAQLSMGKSDSKNAASQGVNELNLIKLLATVEAKAGDKASALARVQKYRQAHPNQLSAALVEADVRMQIQDFGAAATSYQAIFEQTPSAQMAINVFRARRLGKLAAPTQPLEQWLQTHANDVAVRTALADAYQNDGERERAIAEYERVLGVQPINIYALNNLAWLYQQQGDKRAEDTGRKAYELAGQAPAVADTYGWILLQNGRVAEAAKVLSAAAAGAPQEPNIQYHYALALARTGAVEEARKRLTELLEKQPRFTSRTEAERALAELPVTPGSKT